MSDREMQTAEATPAEMRERIAASMRLIQSDMSEDAQRTEGMPLTGRNVGQLFGGVMAAVDACARAIEWLATNGDRP